jgi:hypothetical protein
MIGWYFYKCIIGKYFFISFRMYWSIP